jgi:signal transduction histidine kinase
VGFLGEKEVIDSSLEAKITRYEELVRILNLYIMAFNGIIEAEIQSRFSHRLFAHQTKEPILTIKRQLELLTGDKFKDPDQSKSRDYHERMLRIATRMLKQSQNILDANKRSLEVELEFSKFDLHATVEDVVKNMRKVKDSNSIPGEILFTLPDEAFLVNSDENKIREILEQLIYNSLKYCKDIRKIRVKVGHDSNSFYLDVIDNGFGIPDHEMPYIFRRFFRGEDPMEYSIDGDGLGLWVVKAYIDRLGGDIHTTNIENEYKRIQGTRFSVKIPRTPQKKVKEDMNE